MQWLYYSTHFEYTYEIDVLQNKYILILHLKSINHRHCKKKTILKNKFTFLYNRGINYIKYI
jgi:hypothetical protein